MTVREFLNRGITPWHVQQALIAELESVGYVALDERDGWTLVRGGKYYVTRGAAVLAFAVGAGDACAIAACHTDTPGFRLKQSSAKESAGLTVVLTESYGGGIWHTWTDRPLGVAGRVCVRDGSGMRAVNVDLAGNFVIPSLAVHLNRDVNKGRAFNLSTELNLVTDVDVCAEIARAAGADEADVLSTELCVYARTPAFSVGAHLLASPRIDNLTSAYSMCEAMKRTEPKGIAVALFATHEEVGSMTTGGAGGTLLADTLDRVAASFGLDARRMLASSFLLSVDNAHAVHPLYPALGADTDSTQLGDGIVIKRNPNNRYTTDAETQAAVMLACERAGVPYGVFAVRSDLPCGSTLGVVSGAQVNVRSADIGIGQLAMHAACEVCDERDCDAMTRLLVEFGNRGI